MTARTTESPSQRPTWVRTWGGGVAGLVAGVSMGLVVQFGAGTMALVGALYGQPTLLAGWVAHLFHSVVFALGVVAVVSRPLLSDYTSLPAELVGLGVGYGAALGVFAGGFLFPVGLRAVGATELPVPLLPIPAVVGEFVFPVVFGVAHLVYGALLGGVYAAVAGVESDPRTDDTGIGG
ncbi:hypothetical protein [Halorussus caseinilyticus]|uniref:Histidine kinase n=1 Tax=Halorussus caseinilyticus TaxID=3034025 RepID=A0ABD5WMT9_9EURY|nr:hypothetical protein [Halorussus sp. DT72]